jgi:hypothetical protein
MLFIHSVRLHQGQLYFLAVGGLRTFAKLIEQIAISDAAGGTIGTVASDLAGRTGILEETTNVLGSLSRIHNADGRLADEIESNLRDLLLAVREGLARPITRSLSYRNQGDMRTWLAVQLYSYSIDRFISRVIPIVQRLVALDGKVPPISGAESPRLPKSAETVYRNLEKKLDQSMTTILSRFDTLDERTGLSLDATLQVRDLLSSQAETIASMSEDLEAIQELARLAARPEFEKEIGAVMADGLDSVIAQLKSTLTEAARSNAGDPTIAREIEALARSESYVELFVGLPRVAGARVRIPLHEIASGCRRIGRWLANRFRRGADGTPVGS